MIRTEQPNSHSTPLLDRRQFLRLLGGGGTATAVAAIAFEAGILGAQELQTHFRGYLETSLGRFYDVVERHDRRSKIQDKLNFPENCKGYLAESALMKSALLTDDPLSNLVMTGGSGEDTVPPSLIFVFSESILGQAAAKSVPLLFGDFNFPKILREANYSTVQMVSRFRNLAGAVLSVGLGAACVQDWRYRRTSHRAKLKIALGGTAAFLTTPLLKLVFGSHQFFMNQYASEDTEYRRAAARVDGLLSYLTPENINVFFRNLCIAHKLLFYAQELQHKTGKKPNYVYQYHGGHNGIVDFLRLGLPKCEELLLLLPADFLKIVIEGTGGLRDFCSIRAITLTPDFQVKRKFDLADPVNPTYRVLDRVGGIAEDTIYTNNTFATKLQEKIQREMPQ